MLQNMFCEPIIVYYKLIVLWYGMNGYMADTKLNMVLLIWLIIIIYYHCSHWVQTRGEDNSMIIKTMKAAGTA